MVQKKSFRIINEKKMSENNLKDFQNAFYFILFIYLLFINSFRIIKILVVFS